MTALNSITLQCPAKINLSLDILGKRPDGYHELQTIMQSVSLYDEISIKKTDSEGISLSCNFSYIPIDERNVAYKAAKLFFEATGINQSIHISIKKIIPVGAGLAGGSTNAAGVLIGLNKMFDFPLSEHKILEIGKAVGADVPFCINGGTCFCEGLGEILTPLKPMPNCYFVIVKPKESVSTPKVYSMLSKNAIINRPFTDKLLQTIEDGNLNLLTKYVFNVMEDTAISICPSISTVKSMLSKYSPMCVMMSGSGSSVFAIFNNQDYAQKCKNEMKKHYSSAFICSPCQGIIEN
ncbi:MAG: 4-(cytidine 5'-diphospho)-2-C-methyl-D-erythritol kinase [Ruminococcaceae bacterium]|nr:4-(cytidine 5'-diphospho)-2-C-methyl-D-erythritol kinase [Oscillospiraceae bacterium]